MPELLARPELGVPAGLAGAVLLVLVARAAGRERLFYSMGLGLAAIAYVVFGLARGAPGGHLAVEAAGALVFVTAAVLGGWRWPALLALGWTAHMGWDLARHYAEGPAYAPAWYALVCVGWDLWLGGYIAGRLPGGAFTR